MVASTYLLSNSLALALVLAFALICCCSSMASTMDSNRLALRGNETDKLALLAIKSQIHQHPHRPVMSSWNESTHFCMWHGVTCSRRHLQRVTKLDLSSLMLSGSISPLTGNLSFLRELRLYNNSFTNKIPPEIGHLRQMQILGLQHNSLSGPIPASIYKCSNLIILDVGYNMLIGSFGSVYKGVLSEDGAQLVAVKVFNMLRRGASKSFLAECEALRNIRHRNLVPIITACSSVDSHGNDLKALVYKFMENGSLEEWLHLTTGTEEAPKSLSLVERLQIIIDVACAVDYLHNHCETPIVHCDLKPSNVLLDHDLTGHVADFGLARILSRLADNVSANQSSSIGIRGTVGYAALEYGMGSNVTTYGDIYSFGILLLEMFTGKRPTDHIFTDGLNLHKYVKMAFGERASEIADSSLVQVGNPSQSTNDALEECLSSILGIGVACSVESPTD